MPIIKSQKDRVRQTEKENARNRAIKSNLKTVVKKAEATKEPAQVNEAIAAIGKAESKGVLKKNTAARRMSRVMRSTKG